MSDWKSPVEALGYAAYNPNTGKIFVHKGRVVWANRGGVKAALRAVWDNTVRVSYGLNRSRQYYVTVYTATEGWVEYSPTFTSDDETLTSILPYLAQWAENVGKLDPSTSFKHIFDQASTAWINHFEYRKVVLSPVEP
jgi:hypothetical protein